jgi:NADH:ubiquinone oxidoreductase subunit
VDYAKHDYDAAQIEPGWHAWMSHAVDKPPSQDATLAYSRRLWEDKDAQTIPNHTMTRGAYKPYNT